MRFRDKETGDVVAVRKWILHGRYAELTNGNFVHADDFRERFEPVEQQGKEV